ncbi:hypothetical protein [Dickeya chrysanthemi]|uniref:hypothetical protein n=1 Tax=Dickeya chrysanthemi TaxID=556 RepID=UPI003DA78860
MNRLLDLVTRISVDAQVRTLILQLRPRGQIICQRMLDMHGAAQAHHIGCGVVAGDAGPARVAGPVLLDLFGGLQCVAHGAFS